jgi:hypothetical protein
METRLTIFALLTSVSLLVFIFELVRRRRLKERYSLLWLFTGLAFFGLSLSKQLVDRIGLLVGIYYSPSAFFMLAFLFLTLITIQFSVVISSLSERNKVLTQEVALLKLRLERVEGGTPLPPRG